MNAPDNYSREYHEHCEELAESKGLIPRSIQFTQFLLPDGRPVPIWFYPSEQVPEEIFDMADTLSANGGHFEAEMLTTGEISLECGFSDGPQPLAHVVCQNGPDVVEAVKQLVREAHSELHLVSRD